MRCHVFGVLKERDAKRWSHWCGAGSKATTGKVTVFQVSPLAEMAELLRPGDGRRRVTKLVGITVTRS